MRVFEFEYGDKNCIYVWIKDEKIYINNVFMGGFVDVA